MKRLTLTLCTLAALSCGAFAGSETYSSSKEMRGTAPCPTWYADNEWNIGVSGVYAPTTEEWRNDRYLGVDHAWGGAVDVKYFMRRYFGFGIQGFGLALDNSTFQQNAGRRDDTDFAGGVLGTFTFRYPIPCTRFAPYAWAGIGGIWGGGVRHNELLVAVGDDFRVRSSDGVLMGQYGIGFETRFTPHMGLTTDVSYNQVEYHANDFWQVRAGLNFAF